MAAHPPSIVDALLSWTTTPDANRPVPEAWSSDPLLSRFPTPAAAATAIRRHPLGDQVLARLASLTGDELATTAALAGLALRLSQIAARWRRSAMPAGDMADAEAELVTECLAVLRQQPDLPADVVVQSAWHRSHSRRRAHRARAQTSQALDTELADSRPAADTALTVITNLVDALRGGDLKVEDAAILWATASGTTAAEAAGAAGCTPEAWRKRRSRAIRRARRSRAFRLLEVA